MSRGRLTTRTLNPFLKNWECCPYLISSHSQKYNLCNASNKNSFPPLLMTLGSLMQSEISVKMIYNFAILTNFNRSTLIWSASTFFPYLIFPKIWQDFPDEQIKITRKISELYAKLKNYFIKDLEDTVICYRLLCPSCLAGRPR